MYNRNVKIQKCIATSLKFSTKTTHIIEFACLHSLKSILAHGSSVL